MGVHVVTGGCGFLGRHVERCLRARGLRTRVVDIAPYPASEGVPAPECRVVDLRRATPAEFDEIVADAEVVHHLAWSTIPASANEAPFTDLTDNLAVTIGLLEALRRQGSGRLVFASSGGTVYGRLEQVPAPESHPLAPITAYGVSKVAAENYCRFYRSIHGVDARVARISNPYGAGQNPKRPQGAVSHFVHRALAREPMVIWGDGRVVRDFIHVTDVTAGLVAVAETAFEDRAELPVYNIGSGVGVDLNEIVTAIEARLGRVEVRREPPRSFDVPVSVLDISKARADLGWAPRFDLQGGIARMIADLEADPGALLSSFDPA